MVEKDLHRYVKKKCKELQILFYKLQCQGKRGFPDLLLLKNGRGVFVELKSPKGTGRLSELQKREIARLRSEGVQVEIIKSTSEADSITRELANNCPAGGD
jgi:hypothetical protein